MGRRRLLAIGLSLLLFMVALGGAHPTVAHARAGGGNHSSGGSSSGGGGSYGGGSYSGGGSGYSSGGGYSSTGSHSGGVTGIAMFFVIIMFFGIFGGFFFLMFLIVRRAVRSSAAEYQASAAEYQAPQQYGAAAIPMGGADPSAGLAAIAQADPGFNQQQFLDRTQAAFFQLQKAWMDRNLDEGRAYMSSGLYQSWSVQVQGMVNAHKKDVMENLFIRGAHIVAATHDTNFDQITVRIDASAADYEVDDATGKVVFGKKKDAPFTEYWTFQRSAGAKTLVTGGITESKCPNCGAPLQVNQNGDCRYCNAPVTSGKFDWVLSKIDQAGEWAA